MKKKVTIYWDYSNPDFIAAVRAKYNLPKYTTVNGETEAVVSEDTLQHLLKGAEMRFEENGIKKRYLTIRRIEDGKNCI